MMSPRFADRPYDSHSEFYNDVYREVLVEERRVERAGVSLIRARQAAGDWSDAPTPDLVINLLTSAPVRASLELGAGLMAETMARDSFVVVPPRTATTILVDGAHDVTLIAVPWSRLLSLADEANLPADGDFGALHRRATIDGPMLQTFRTLWTAAGWERPGDTLMAQGALLQMAAHLLRLQADGRPLKHPKGGLASWQERRATEFLNNHLAEDVTLDTLAGVAGLSTFHFARQFKQSTGLPPHAYLRRLRCERAKELLAGTTLPVTEIAAQVGYETPQAFARMFRAEVGASPSTYRRERRS